MSTNTKMTSTNTSSEQQLTADNKRYNAINRIPRMKEGDKLRLWLSFSPPPEDKWSPGNDIMVDCKTIDEAWKIACNYTALHYIGKPPPSYTSSFDMPNSNKDMLNMHMICATDEFQIALLSGIDKPNMNDWVDMGFKNWTNSNIPPLIMIAKDYLREIEIEVEQRNKYWKEHSQCTKDGGCYCME